MMLKLILDFLFTDISQHFRRYLVVFALKHFIMGMGKRGDVKSHLCCEISHRTTTQI